MLPGFRFLFAAIVLSMSILVFGLGAAALLRAAHEAVASNPSWRTAPETVFAQQGEINRPMLAMLRVEPEPAAPKVPDNVPVIAAPVEPATVASAPAEPAASASTPAEPERIAALKSDEPSPPETVKPAIPAAETPAQSAAPPPQADAATAAGEPKIATSEQASPDQASPERALPPANETAPAATETTPAVSEQISTPAAPESGATKLATLGGPAVIAEAAKPAKATSAKPDPSTIKKRRHARRAAQRRRMAAQAPLAQQPLQPATDPFNLPVPKARAR